MKTQSSDRGWKTIRQYFSNKKCKSLPREAAKEFEEECSKLRSEEQAKLQWSQDPSQTNDNLKNSVFWDVMPYGSCKNRCFRRTYHLRHQGDTNWQARNVISN
jgi:hypothetical protein